MRGGAPPRIVIPAQAGIQASLRRAAAHRHPGASRDPGVTPARRRASSSRRKNVTPE
jgi:hypothetical protein